MRLDGAMLFVKDLDRMTAFYRDVLGLEPIDETRLEDWVEFRGEGVRFSLHRIPSAIATVIRIDSPPRPREQSSARLSLRRREPRHHTPEDRGDGTAIAAASFGWH
jgi:catechol 2,3-dioxygenase-like lactoylglutathione lyase family enzyme